VKQSKKILVIQHSDKESLGIIGVQLLDYGIDYSYIKPFYGEDFPIDVNMFSGLIILGGPQSAYQEKEFPYLAKEKDFIKKAIDDDIPILGICLGSQLLAEILGSKVSSGPKMRIGWEPVELSQMFVNNYINEAAIKTTIQPLHWHKDIFELPPEASQIASSKNTTVEGFIWRKNVWGLVFHLEADLTQIEEMANTFKQDLLDAGISNSKLMKLTHQYLKESNRVGKSVFSSWIQLLDGNK